MWEVSFRFTRRHPRAAKAALGFLTRALVTAGLLHGKMSASDARPSPRGLGIGLDFFQNASASRERRTSPKLIAGVAGFL